MGFEDRQYYRDGPRGPGYFGPVIYWLLYGRVPLFSAFGIRVQAHSSLLVVIILTLLIGGPGFVWQDKVISAALLFLMVLLHEFGHCFGARWVGGEADEIVMHPLGGLALARPPHTWRAHLITAAAGPAVNVVFCIVCGLALYLMTGQIPWRPFVMPFGFQYRGWLEPTWLLFWLFQTNWMLLAFNLLPCYPLDGGQITQAILWPFLGYYRSMLMACNVGIVGGILFGMVGLASGAFYLFILGMLGLLTCLQMRTQLIQAGPYAFDEYDDPYTQSLQTTRRADSRDAKKARALAERQARQLDRLRKDRAAEEAEIDRILAKVSAGGMNSLSRGEQKTLRDATARQQQREGMHR